MPMTSKQMVKLLKQNGFIEIRQAGSHKILNNPVTNRSVVVPFHAKDLPKGTERNKIKGGNDYEGDLSSFV
ncbi:type II toxin-antitoxin system HicA family toxin [[Clostridium] innocuum]|nr:type II toxin-antitoxin system HicA family toxin [[Clostridium] innocuum]